jgi:hypothetical protein
MDVRHLMSRVSIGSSILILLAGCGSTPILLPTTSPATPSTSTAPPVSTPSPAPPPTAATPTATPAFSGTGQMAAARNDHSATLLDDGRVLVAGGWDGIDGHLASTELYDPVTGIFHPTGRMSVARTCHTATLLTDGRVLVAGGDNLTQPDLTSAELFDPVSGTFSPTGRMQASRCGATATLLLDGRVLIAGGSRPGEPLDSAELYDPETATFTATAVMTEPRSGHTAVLLRDGRVLLAGTEPSGSGAEGPHATAELFDPASATFTATGRMASGRSRHTATLLPDGRVLVAGGAAGLASAELFDPATATFSPTGEMTERRHLHTATSLPDGRVLIVGGESRGILAYAELYDPQTGTFGPAGSMADRRLAHTATTLADGRVLVAGGTSAHDNSALATAELYEIARGAPAPSSAPPSASVTTPPVRTSAADHAVAMAPSRDGHLFVAVSDGDDTVLTGLDRGGKALPGWPLRLERASECRLLVDPGDGSVRAACADDGRWRAVVWAFDEAAKTPGGWPVVLPNSSVPTLRFVSVDLYGAAEGPDIGRKRLLAISPDGAVRNGPAFVVYTADVAVGPDGTVYTVQLAKDGSDILAVTMDGPRSGWPVHVTGWSSIPSFGPDGQVYVVVDELDGLYGKNTNSSSRVLALSRDGRAVPGWPARIPIDTLTGGPEGVVYPDPPVVVPDGSVYIVVGPGTYALDPTGQMRTGWPYESTATLVTGIVGVGTCPSGCGSMCAIPDVNSPPLASPDGTLHLAQNTKGDVYAGANRIVAVGANGDVMAGWPVTLVEKGAWFDTFAVGDDESVFGFALEPAGTEPNRCGGKSPVYSGTVVAFDGHGDPIYTTTLVAP